MSARRMRKASALVACHCNSSFATSSDRFVASNCSDIRSSCPARTSNLSRHVHRCAQTGSWSQELEARASSQAATSARRRSRSACCGASVGPSAPLVVAPSTELAFDRVDQLELKPEKKAKPSPSVEPVACEDADALFSTQHSLAAIDAAHWSSEASRSRSMAMLLSSCSCTCRQSSRCSSSKAWNACPTVGPAPPVAVAVPAGASDDGEWAPGTLVDPTARPPSALATDVASTSFSLRCLWYSADGTVYSCNFNVKNRMESSRFSHWARQ
mmetsp:Transcript_31136/g.85284  ORF Transcript_31136/g.85284 Transcript_31136/m.85284 type:complete len:271 (-) Transcript_31136:490-1302(-)